MLVASGAAICYRSVKGEGTLFTVLCGLVYGTYGFFSGAIGERLSTAPRIANLMKWLTGSVLIGLGVRLALPDKK